MVASERASPRRVPRGALVEELGERLHVGRVEGLVTASHGLAFSAAPIVSLLLVVLSNARHYLRSRSPCGGAVSMAAPHSAASGYKRQRIALAVIVLKLVALGDGPRRISSWVVNLASHPAAIDEVERTRREAVARQLRSA